MFLDPRCSKVWNGFSVRCWRGWEPRERSLKTSCSSCVQNGCLRGHDLAVGMVWNSWNILDRILKLVRSKTLKLVGSNLRTQNFININYQWIFPLRMLAWLPLMLQWRCLPSRHWLPAPSRPANLRCRKVAFWSWRMLRLAEDINFGAAIAEMIWLNVENIGLNTVGRSWFFFR